MLIQLVPQSIGLLPRVVLFIPKRSPTLFVPLVGVFHVYRRELILVVFKSPSPVLRWSGVVRKEVEVGAIRGECPDLCMAGRVAFPDKRQGLVPGVDESGSVIAALQLRFFHVFPTPLALPGQVRQCHGKGILIIKNRPVDKVIDWERAEFLHCEPFDKVRLWSS